MAEITLTQFPKEPATFDPSSGTQAAANGGDYFRNVGKVGLWVENSSGVERTVTVVAQNPCNFGVTHSSAIAVADGFAGFLAHSFDADRYNDSSGQVQLTYSDEGGLDLAAIQFAE